MENRIGHFGQVAEQLVFQISEIDVLIAQHHMDYFCHKLNPLNINLCVSHFGCTANPFRYLPLLCAHSVKLDVSLPEKLRLNPMKIQLLKRTINQLHETGLRVIAAMIDDISLLPLLWLSKVNFAQGYCLSRTKLLACRKHFQVLRKLIGEVDSSCYSCSVSRIMRG